MMAEIVNSYVEVLPRRLVPPDVYFGNADPDDRMVVETVVIQWVNPFGTTCQKHVSWAYNENGFL